MGLSSGAFMDISLGWVARPRLDGVSALNAETTCSLGRDFVSGG